MHEIVALARKARDGAAFARAADGARLARKKKRAQEIFDAETALEKKLVQQLAQFMMRKMTIRVLLMALSIGSLSAVLRAKALKCTVSLLPLLPLALRSRLHWKAPRLSTGQRRG